MQTAAGDGQRLNTSTHHSFALFHIDLVPKHHEREVIRVSWGCLDQELVPPAVERIEALGVVDVEDEDAAIRATVEGNTQRLESFLSCCVPELLLPPHLSTPSSKLHTNGLEFPHLHRHLAVVHLHLACEEVGTDRSFVAGAEPLVDLERNDKRLISGIS